MPEYSFLQQRGLVFEGNLFHRLRIFHRRCARTMCRISIVHTIYNHISYESLFGRLAIESLNTYCHRRGRSYRTHAAEPGVTDIFNEMGC